MRSRVCARTSESFVIDVTLVAFTNVVRQVSLASAMFSSPGSNIFNDNERALLLPQW